MTTRHHTVGGQTRKISTHAPRQRPAGQILISCDDCQAQYMTAVNIGQFDIYKPCDCGAMIRVRGRYDGYNVIVSGTIEAVEHAHP